MTFNHINKPDFVVACLQCVLSATYICLVMVIVTVLIIVLKYCMDSLMDSAMDLILDYSLVQCTDTISSVATKKEGL